MSADNGTTVSVLQRVREDPEGVRAMLAARHFAAPLDRLLDLDAKVRQLQSEKEQLQAERNKASKGGPPTDAVKARMREVGDRIKAIDAELGPLTEERDEAARWIPNAIAADVPPGKDEHDNPVLREDSKRDLDFEAKPHWEVGEALGILDIPRGARLAGSRFYVLRGAGAALQRALIAWMIDLKLDAGFTEIYPPFVTRKETLLASAHLPHFDENLYRDDDDDIWLIPTAETQLISLHRDETLPLERLPIRYVAYTACFRREKMSAGRDVRGIKRGHQFDKVEMVVLTKPEDSPAELLFLTDLAVQVLEKLELPVRVVERCAGDLGFTAMKGFDVETWSPGVKEWLEVSSCSDGGSLQAERAQIRFKRDRTAKVEHPHILNASGVALPRLMISVLENYQQADGSVVIPKAIRGYLRGRERIAPGEFTL
ncbi:MAG TPA: serine--tRNA ligase [Candidatus Limnocylindria bacterium]|nr:serine--tRNA ligase [Candidatus Limnocylindria bacterium]